MRHVKPSRDLLDYVDYEMKGLTPPPPPTVAPVPATAPGPRGGPGLLALTLAALAVLATLAIASLALGQDVALACGEVPDIACEPEADEPTLAPAPAIDTPSRPAVEPARVPAAGVDPGVGPLFTGVVGVLLLTCAIGMVIGPPWITRVRVTREHRERRERAWVESRRGGRARNEDASSAFVAGVFDGLCVADGLGGHAGGARASQLVVSAAESHLAHVLPRAAADELELVEDFVRGAFARAARALAAEDEILGLGARSIDALRSTLIVAIATPDAYLVAAQGDGGAWVRRAGGAVEPLMTPAKGASLSVVAASLGPQSDGEVVVRRLDRRPGDLLVVGTDGIADRIGDTFHEALARYVKDAATVRAAVTEVLDQLEQDPKTFDDNTTLGAIATPMG